MFVLKGIPLCPTLPKTCSGGGGGGGQRFFFSFGERADAFSLPVERPAGLNLSQHDPEQLENTNLKRPIYFDIPNGF